MAYPGYENDLTPEQRAKLNEIREFKELCERGERKQRPSAHRTQGSPGTDRRVRP